MKSCMNCAYRKGGFEYGKCVLTGGYIQIQRRHLEHKACDINFSGWEQRPTIPQKIIAWIKGN